jgi:hypothetical protein
MTTHSQDNGSPIWRAWASVPAHTLGDALDVDRVGDHRDVAHESLVSTLYEELRLLTKDELYPRAGLVSPKGHPRGRYSSYGRQALIAMIIEQEL